jgi:hypothetical protein
MNVDFTKALETARKQREALVLKRAELDAERKEVDVQIMQLEKAIESLSPLTNEDPAEVIIADYNRRFAEGLRNLGLADACRAVLQSNGMFMTPTAIRDTLETQGFPLEQYSNPLASIHGILKRFEDSGEVIGVAIGNKTAYRIAPQYAVIQAEERDILSKRKVAASTDPLTNAVLGILKTAPNVGMTPAEIGDALKQLGFIVKAGSDFEGWLHDIWISTGEILKRTDARGKITYRLLTDKEKKERDEANLKRKQK